MADDDVAVIVDATAAADDAPAVQSRADLEANLAEYQTQLEQVRLHLFKERER